MLSFGQSVSTKECFCERLTHYACPEHQMWLRQQLDMTRGNTVSSEKDVKLVDKRLSNLVYIMKQWIACLHSGIANSNILTDRYRNFRYWQKK